MNKRTTVLDMYLELFREKGFRLEDRTDSW